MSEVPVYPGIQLRTKCKHTKTTSVFPRERHFFHKAALRKTYAKKGNAPGGRGVAGAE